MKDLKKTAGDIRKKVLLMHAKVDASHIGSAFSCVEILVEKFY